MRKNHIKHRRKKKHKNTVESKTLTLREKQIAMVPKTYQARKIANR